MKLKREIRHIYKIATRNTPLILISTMRIIYGYSASYTEVILRLSNECINNFERVNIYTTICISHTEVILRVLTYILIFQTKVITRVLVYACVLSHTAVLLGGLIHTCLYHILR